MKVFLQFLSSVALVALLYGFAMYRSEEPIITDLNVELMNRTGSVLDEAVVNKLLIQKEGPDLLSGGDRVVLKGIEEEVGKIPSVQRVEAFRRFSGQYVVQIWTREPVARISGSPSYLVDREGVQLPLSDYKTAPLPLVSGAVEPDRMKDLCTLINAVQDDSFLRSHIIGIGVEEEGDFNLHTRTADYVVHLAGIEGLERRLRNYKVFYQKARRDSILDLYRAIDLTCSNQVVCTKKQRDGRD